MKLSEVLKNIHAPKGQSTMIAAVSSLNFDSVQPQNAIGTSLNEAETALEKARTQQANAGSDWAYWGYAGDAAYWECVVDLLKASEMVGPDNLPDVELPSFSGAVMDVLEELKDFGKKVLQRTAYGNGQKIP